VNVYEKLGVRRVINAYGNLTPLGGSLMNPEVLKAMAAGSQSFVDLNDLLKRAGQRIATLVGVEAAYITSGASAGLAIATAACVAGKDPENIARLPDTTGMKSEVLTHRCQRNVWDQAVRVAGAKLVEFGHPPKAQASDFESALTDRTAAVLYFVDHNESQSLPLADLIAKAKAHEVPVIVEVVDGPRHITRLEDDVGSGLHRQHAALLDAVALPYSVHGHRVRDRQAAEAQRVAEES